MKTNITAVLTALLLHASLAFGQKPVNGRVTANETDGKPVPLPYANVYWSGTQEGTVADENGRFSLERKFAGPAKLVVSFVGYLNDTLLVEPDRNSVQISLKKGAELAEVEIRERMAGSFISSIRPIKTEVITTAGLQKLACCNLSESFENNATVDVGFSDAVTGARQIQMLGLAGI